MGFYDVLFFSVVIHWMRFTFSKSRTQHTRAIQVSYLNLNTLKSKYFVVLAADCIVNSVFEKQCVFPQMATICVFQFHHHDVLFWILWYCQCYVYFKSIWWRFVLYIIIFHWRQWKHVRSEDVNMNSFNLILSYSFSYNLC